MELGMIGMGRMGANMTERLVAGGIKVICFDKNPDTKKSERFSRFTFASSLGELIANLKAPHILWLMIPSGASVDSAINEMLPALKEDDVIIDGGNSNYKDSMRRAAMLSEARINYLDVGTSGGIWGLKEGYCLMIGGEKAVVERLAPIFETLAPAKDKGWGYAGSSGTGHFVKMIHNGIEYGMMQALAEGFAIMKAKKEFDIDIAEISKVWQNGSVIRSWLLDLIKSGLEEDSDLSNILPYVEDSGEGRWTASEAIELNIPAPIITLSLLSRLRSRDIDSFSDKMLAMMRNQFGGHNMKLKE